MKQYAEIRENRFVKFLRNLGRQIRIILREIKLFLAIRYDLCHSKRVKLGKIHTSNNPKKIIFFTYIEENSVSNYEQVLMRSLFQSGNIPALLEQGYLIELCVYAQESDKLMINKIIDEYQNNLPEMHKQFFQVNLNGFPSPQIVTFKNAFFKTMQLCLQSDAYCFMAAADIFFGNHSINNMVKLTMGRDLCIASLHLKVEKEHFLKLIHEVSYEVSNNTLVSKALKSAHKNHLTEISIQPVIDHLFSATCREPIVFLMSFHESDLKYFSKYTFNHWNHAWPALLMKQRRYKVTGSSELFFAVEMEEGASQGDHSFNSHQMEDHDRFHVPASHGLQGEVNGGFCMILQGEEPFVIHQ